MVFLFINRLDATLRGNAGVPYDGSFASSKNAYFNTAKTAIVYLNDGTVLNDVKFNSKKALKVQGDVIPGETVDFKISLDELDLKYYQHEKVNKIETVITDSTTREVENVTFTRDGDILKAQVPTVISKTNFHMDVLILIVIFGLTMYIAQKIMMASNKNQKLDPQQEAIQKSMGTMMPIMLTATFVFIPIPAGVLLYLIASNIIQVIQTIIINKQIECEEAGKKTSKTYGNVTNVIDADFKE